MGGTHPTRPKGASRTRRRAAVALSAALALYGAAQLAVSLPSTRAALHARLERELRERLGAEVTVGPAVEVDWAFRLAFGPVELRPPTAKAAGAAATSGAAPRGGATAPAAAPATVRIERVKARASGLALLAGRLEPASIRLAGVRVSPGPRGRSLRALVAAARAGAQARSGEDGGAPGGDGSLASLEPGRGDAEAAGPRARADRPLALRALPRVHARGVVVVAELRDRTFELGPLDADVSARAGADGERAELAIRLPGGGRAAAELARTGSPGDGGAAWRVRVRAEGLEPDDLPAALRTLPARLEAGAISLELEAAAPAALDRAEGRLRVGGEGLFVSGERIAEAPVGPLRADVRGTVRWDGTERRLSLSEGALVLAGGALPLDVEGELRLGASFPFALVVRAAGVDHAAVVAALPPALAPPPEAPRPQGTFDARLEISGPALAPAAWSVAATLDLSRMREASRKLRPQPLREPFVHVPQQPARSPNLRAPGFLVGPGNPDFVPVADLPEHVVRAVTASEDAGFFAHHGFDFAELGLAFAAGAERGRVVRGGSTITQQLAKNLYLGREKTLARKVREAAITLALEACLPKARLLEIYLNVAEWGPGVHGIGPAARHWFGKDARALTPREAAFLASVIPNPVRYDAMRTRGVSAGWESRVDELLLKMNEQGALSEEDLLRALGDPIVLTGG
jgi:hypothetical protein